MIATVAILDQAVADFLKGIRADGVLDDTLVIITSDESHGDDIGEWASSWEKAEEARNCGCTHPILYRDTDFVGAVREITGGQGVDVVYDSVGQATFMQSLDCLRPLGTMVSFGQRRDRCRRSTSGCWRPVARCFSPGRA